jgi:hypothetical protein
MQTESFTIGARNGICEILTVSQLSGEKLTGLFDFAFNTYAPIAMLSESTSSGGGYAYLIASKGKLDLCRLLEVLGRNELGWCLTDGIVHSPSPSKLGSKVVLEAIDAARSLVEVR